MIFLLRVGNRMGLSKHLLLICSPKGHVAQFTQKRNKRTKERANEQIVTTKMCDSDSLFFRRSLHWVRHSQLQFMLKCYTEMNSYTGGRWRNPADIRIINNNKWIIGNSLLLIFLWYYIIIGKSKNFLKVIQRKEFVPFFSQSLQGWHLRADWATNIILYETEGNFKNIIKIRHREHSHNRVNLWPHLCAKKKTEIGSDIHFAIKKAIHWLLCKM